MNPKINAGISYPLSVVPNEKQVIIGLGILGLVNPELLFHHQCGDKITLQSWNKLSRDFIPTLRPTTFSSDYVQDWLNAGQLRNPNPTDWTPARISPTGGARFFFLIERRSITNKTTHK